MTTGRVQTFSMRRGYGCIEVEGRDEPVFLHYGDVAEDVEKLEAGDRVEFELVEEDGSEARARAVVKLGD